MSIASAKKMEGASLYAYYSRNSVHSMAATMVFTEYAGGAEKFFSTAGEAVVRTNPVVVNASNIQSQIGVIKAMDTGLITLVGDPGVGKTTRVPLMIEQATCQPVVVLVPNTIIAAMAKVGAEYHTKGEATVSVMSLTEEIAGNSQVLYMDTRSFIKNSMCGLVLRTGGTLIIDESQLSDPMVQAANELARVYAKVMRVVQLAGTSERQVDYALGAIKVEPISKLVVEDHKRVLHVSGNVVETEKVVAQGFQSLDIDGSLSQTCSLVADLRSARTYRVVGPIDAAYGLNLPLDAVICTDTVDRMFLSGGDIRFMREKVPPGLVVQAMRRLRDGGTFFSRVAFDPKNVKATLTMNSIEKFFCDWLVAMVVGGVVNLESPFRKLRKKTFTEALVSEKSWKHALLIAYSGSTDGPPPYEPKVTTMITVYERKAIFSRCKLAVAYVHFPGASSSFTRFNADPDFPRQIVGRICNTKWYAHCIMSWRNWITREYMRESLLKKHNVGLISTNWVNQLIHIHTYMSLLFGTSRQKDLLQFEYDTDEPILHYDFFVYQ